jgi:S-DNA-T family DNA segregation ATPase FtsK/SpoIIIE
MVGRDHRSVATGLISRLAYPIKGCRLPHPLIPESSSCRFKVTVQAVESRANEIYTSEGIKIIHHARVRPVSIAIERPNRQVLHTEPVLLSTFAIFV